MNNRFFLLTIFSLIIFFQTLPLNAQISADYGGINGGGVRIGQSTTTCNNSSIGSIRWNNVNKIHEFCDGVNWASMIPGCGARPDDFSFSNITGAAASSIQNSTIVQMTGISCATADVSITGGGSPQYRVCSDSSCSVVVQNWTNTTTPIANNQFVQLRMTASPTSLQMLTVTVTIGGQARNWSVTTQDLGTFKYVFLVANFGGAIGGIAGADTRCNNAATTAGLPGTYMAWLATGDADDPDSRFTTKATVPYRMVNNALVANNWTDLTDGLLSAGILLLANGTSQFSSSTATNVATDGTAKFNGTNNCAGWMSNGTAINGHAGLVGSNSTQWTDHSVNACNLPLTLICFQQ